MLSYQLQGVEESLRRLSRLSGLEGLDSELEAAGDEIVPTLREYPPERAGQRYVRTEALKGGWRRQAAKRSGNAVEVDIDNPIPYGPFVMGDEQAWMHRGRWKRLRAIGEEKVSDIRARVQAWALRTWRGG